MVSFVDRIRLAELLSRETQRFVDTHPASAALYKRAQSHLLAGVPMPWMVRWAGPFPIFVREGKGAYFPDVGGHRYLDFCLGDTGAMTGHAPDETVRAMTQQLGRGLTFMLPMEDSILVAEELARRFGLPYWQIAMTATDANRFLLRLARQITGRRKVLVFNYCYHGTVDECFITLRDGIAGPRDGNLGPPVNPTETTRAIEFNDIAALEAALADRDVACVLAEPVMTNIGIVHPEPGYHDALRRLTARTETLLILDETHTICAGPGGYTLAHTLQPDMLVIGKPIGGGMPVAAYGMAEHVAEKVRQAIRRDEADTGGIGGTLTANPLAMAAVRATLAHVLTDAYYAAAFPLAEQFAAGIQQIIATYQLPWNVTRLGNRVEYWFCATPARNGGEAAAAIDPDLDRFMHLWALNRGILMTPFHNMALIAPDTQRSDIDYHTQVFGDAVAALLGK
ncbi:MAG: aspartate aminotransferase family protein [Anaerolineales bacterium]|nr:aspartate aminotransferase family protein [Anaerolineales bacterium]